MNIAIIHYTAPPIIGGVESVIAHHARLMDRAGHKVRIIAGRGRMVDRNIPFVSIRPIDSRHTTVEAIKSQLDLGLVPEEFHHLVKDIRQKLEPALQDIDLVFAHNVCSLHKNLALTAALKEISEQPGAPRFVLWHHDLAWTSSRYLGELHDGYPWDLLRVAWPRTRQVVVSEHRREELADLQKLAEEQITVIPNGVDLPFFLKLSLQTRQILQQLDLLRAAPLLILPVRITQRKNIELALRCVAELRRRFPDAALVVTGPLGPHNPANRTYFDMLKSARMELGLEGKAHFLAESVEGDLPNDVIADLYRVADALFLPSREEGFGIPVLEAGLAGIPVFCADIPALRQLAGEEASYFSPNADPKKLAKMVATRLESNAQYRLRRQVRRRFTWENIYSLHIAKLIEGIDAASN